MLQQPGQGSTRRGIPVVLQGRPQPLRGCFGPPGVAGGHSCKELSEERLLLCSRFVFCWQESLPGLCLESGIDVDELPSFESQLVQPAGSRLHGSSKAFRRRVLQGFVQRCLDGQMLGVFLQLLSSRSVWARRHLQIRAFVARPGCSCALSIGPSKPRFRWARNHPRGRSEAA